MKLKVIVEPSEDGGFSVHVPALRGCHTQGETLEEALENARDAITTYLMTAEEIAKKAEHFYDIEVAL
ncbi:MAG: type II toxin-antitoxin system HicB family antitoxin [Candidatus Xenobiia bacterium LiM19]